MLKVKLSADIFGTKRAIDKRKKLNYESPLHFPTGWWVNFGPWLRLCGGDRQIATASCCLVMIFLLARFAQNIRVAKWS